MPEQYVDTAESRVVETAEPEFHIQAQRERLLLFLGGTFVAVNWVSLALIRERLSVMDALPLVIWILAAAAGHLTLNRTLPDRDPLLFPLAMFLSGWGLVMIDRLAPNFGERQMVWLGVSTVAMLAAASNHRLITALREYRYTILIVGIALLATTILFGTNPSGTSGAPELWLGAGGLYFQPSEALKIFLVVFLASYLAENYTLMRGKLITEQNRIMLPPRIFGPILLMWGVCVVVLVWQRDLGTAVLFFAGFLVLMYAATGSIFILIAGGLMITVAAIAAYFAFDVVAQRVDIWLNPWADASGRAYQLVQSLMAFSAGGVFGEGIGQGMPIFIPVVHSDFIFAAVAEEFGLVGVAGIIASFAVLALRGMRIALARQDQPFLALMAVGLTTMIIAQSLLIMGGTLRVIPLTGVTLPLMSYGGSSLLATFVMIGLMLRLSAREP